MDEFELKEHLCHSILHAIKISIFERLEEPDLIGTYQIGIWRFLGNQKLGCFEENEDINQFPMDSFNIKSEFGDYWETKNLDVLKKMKISINFRWIFINLKCDDENKHVSMLTILAIFDSYLDCDQKMEILEYGGSSIFNIVVQNAEWKIDLNNAQQIRYLLSTCLESRAVLEIFLIFSSFEN
ncbi:unnamed protein product [Caenorhabditis angaria]|uniref:Uncharacterized protein n=1 Tax=Caenorhabditis angaria TaxID=860376 RepID=A0A9P1IMH0_9PELO|nr:unnamed protein product [Caenorhabditis angaria]